MTDLLPLLQQFHRDKLEQRCFEQAVAGRTELLGRRDEQLAPSHGEVLSSRWIE